MPDHFGDQLAPVPALMAAAAVTTTLVRVGALVWDNDYNIAVVYGQRTRNLIHLLSAVASRSGSAPDGWRVMTSNQAFRSIRTNAVRLV